MKKRKTVNVFIIIMVFIILGSEIVLATNVSNSFNLEDFNLSVDTLGIDRPYISTSAIDTLNFEISKQIKNLSKLSDQELINTTEFNQIINRIILNKSFVLRLEYESMHYDENNGKSNIAKEEYIEKELSYFKDEMFAELGLVSNNVTLQNKDLKEKEAIVDKIFNVINKVFIGVSVIYICVSTVYMGDTLDYKLSKKKNLI